MTIKKNLLITELYNYPLKSSRGSLLKTVEVLPTGFRDDRIVALVDSKDKIVTGREHPQLLKLQSEISQNSLTLQSTNSGVTHFPLPKDGKEVQVKLFRNAVYGYEFDNTSNEWISNYLDGTYRLIYIQSRLNPVLGNRGGEEGELKTYADSSPVHLINLASLHEVNIMMDKKVGVRNFRPNMVIEGAEPFEEDTWSRIQINEVIYRVQEKTQRCIFTTIDPITCNKHTDMEPLASIAQMRLKKGLKPTFGINLVPLNSGTVSVGDEILAVNRSHNNI